MEAIFRLSFIHKSLESLFAYLSLSYDIFQSREKRNVREKENAVTCVPGENHLGLELLALSQRHEKRLAIAPSLAVIRT